MIIAIITVLALGYATGLAYQHNKETKPLNHATEISNAENN